VVERFVKTKAFFQLKVINCNYLDERFASFLYQLNVCVFKVSFIEASIAPAFMPGQRKYTDFIDEH